MFNDLRLLKIYHARMVLICRGSFVDTLNQTEKPLSYESETQEMNSYSSLFTTNGKVVLVLGLRKLEYSF